MLGKKLVMHVSSAFTLTTLKQELSGESGEENRESQVTGLTATFERRSAVAGGLIHSGFI